MRLLLIFLLSGCCYALAADSGRAVIDIKSNSGSAVVDIKDGAGNFLHRILTTVTSTAAVAAHKILSTFTASYPPSGALLDPISDVTINEEEHSQVVIPARVGARIFIEGQPPGSIWNEVTRTLKMYPDFISGGRDYPIQITAIDGAETDTGIFTITVNNNIDPPDPVIIESGTGFNTFWHKIEIRTPENSFLGDANHVYQTVVTIPNPVTPPTEPLPLVLSLHSGGGSTKTTDPDGTIRIASSGGTAGSAVFGFRMPEESVPFSGLHTGRHSDYPSAATANSVFYEATQNRNLLVIDWIRRTFTTPTYKADLDMNRISTTGSSMGGTGGIYFITRYGYYITKAHTSISGNAAKYFASSYNQGFYTQFWGNINGETKAKIGLSAWEIYDYAAAVLNVNESIFSRPWAKQVYFFGQNGVTDNSSSFKNWTQVASNTGTYLLDALQQTKTPHHVCWDNQDHGGGDPVLAAEGYSAFWCESKAAAAYQQLRLNRAYVAFSNSSIDWNPPLYNDATQAFDLDPNSDLRGGINRHITWDNDSVVDQHDRFEIDLFVTTEAFDPNQNTAYPPPGEGYQGTLPVTVDVTLRREQKFIGLPGEKINWTFGTQSGQLTVAANADITVEGLELIGTAQKLVLTRVGWQ